MNPQVFKYLERDVMQNIVSLKMLTAHGGAQSFYRANNFGEAVMIVLKPTAFRYDRERDPNSDCICITSSDHPIAEVAIPE